MIDDTKVNKTVIHVFEILDAINASESPLGVSELTRDTGLPKTTVFRLLSTLEYLGIVNADSIQRYQMGPKIIEYAKSADHQNSIVKIAKPYMQKYAEEYHENINIGILYENQVLYLHSEEGEKFNLQVNLFPVAPLYCSSMGKIFMSEFSEEELQRYLDKTDLHKRTINTLVDPSKLKREIKEIANTGMSYDKEEYEYGLTCIAVPLYQDGEVVAAASVSGPTSRLKVRGWEKIQTSIVDFGKTIDKLL